MRYCDFVHILPKEVISNPFISMHHPHLSKDRVFITRVDHKHENSAICVFSPSEDGKGSYTKKMYDLSSWNDAFNASLPSKEDFHKKGLIPMSPQRIAECDLVDTLAIPMMNVTNHINRLNPEPKSNIEKHGNLLLIGWGKLYGLPIHQARKACTITKDGMNFTIAKESIADWAYKHFQAIVNGGRPTANPTKTSNQANMAKVEPYLSVRKTKEIESKKIDNKPVDAHKVDVLPNQKVEEVIKRPRKSETDTFKFLKKRRGKSMKNPKPECDEKYRCSLQELINSGEVKNKDDLSRQEMLKFIEVCEDAPKTTTDRYFDLRSREIISDEREISKLIPCSNFAKVYVENFTDCRRMKSSGVNDRIIVRFPPCKLQQ